MKKVFVLGSINVDYVMAAPRMPQEGETMHGDGFFINGGGKGANQAVAAARYGAPTYMIACVGSDAFGAKMIEDLRGYGVDPRFIRTVADEVTGAAQITVIGGNNRILLYSGANYRLEKEDVDRALATAEAGDVLIAQNEIRREMTEYGLRAAYERGLVTVFNPAPARDLPASLLRYVRVLVLNEIEAAQAAGTDDVAAAMNELRGRGAGSVVVTLGKSGSRAADGGEVRVFSAIRVQAVDTTAAGDTFIGVLGGGLAEGQALFGCIPAATVASGLAVTRKGAQCSVPARAETEQYMREHGMPVPARP